MFRYFDPKSAPFDQPLPSPDCTLIAPILTAYFDLEAPGSDAVRVQQHLSNCARCAQMWRDWGDARALLQTTSVPAPPYALAAQIVQISRLSALLPNASLTGKLAIANRHDDAIVPPQLQDAILAATTRAASRCDSISDAVVTQRDFSQRDFRRPVRAAKSLAAMTAVPALALWLITLAASDSSFFAPQSAESRVAISSVASQPAVSKAPSLQSAQPLIAPTKTAPTPLAVISQRLSAPVAPAPVAPSPVAENVNSVSEPNKSRENALTLASWPDSKIVAATPISASVITNNLSSASPLAASPLTSVTPRATVEKATLASAKPIASRVRSTVLSRAVAPRRSAQLSTVSMTTLPLSSAMLARPLPNAGDAPRMAMALDAPSAQKATLPVAARRDTSDEALWQSDVAPGRSALAVVQALNDNRPRELRDAFDAYAQTLMDDSDSAATAL